MDPIFAIDVESIFSTYGEKYTNELELLTQTIDNCLLKDSMNNDKNKELLASSLTKRIIINCTIEKYQNVLDDIEIVKTIDYKFNKEVFYALVEAEFALAFENYRKRLEEGQNKYGHNFKSRIRALKAFNIKQWLKEDIFNDETKAE